MILCVCKNVSEKRVLELKCQGKSLREVMKLSEAGTDCGSCSSDLMRCLDLQGELDSSSLDRASRK